MSYSRQYIIDEVNKTLNHVQELYKANFVNYKGKTTDTDEYFTEIAAEELLNQNIFGAMRSINEIVRLRNSGYKVKSHDGINHTENSNRKEEIYCKDLFALSRDGKKIFNEIGTIFDYQVPLKHSRSDIGAGKIDLVSITDDEIWLLELKVEDNKETVLRCVLEIATYYQVLSKSVFIDSYPEYPGHTVDHIKKGILVMKESSQDIELNEMNNGERVYLKQLMNVLNVEAFIIDTSHNVNRI